MQWTSDSMSVVLLGGMDVPLAGPSVDTATANELIIIVRVNKQSHVDVIFPNTT